MYVIRRLAGHARRHVIACLALVLVVGSGTAYASHLVYSSDIVDGQVRSVDVADDGLTGVDIDERTLDVARLGCQPGKVLGFARITGRVSMPATYTSSSLYVNGRSCSGASLLVRRASPGVYFVRFPSNPATLAVATANQDGATSTFSGDINNIVTVGRVTSGTDAGAFRVDVRDITVGHQDGGVTLVLP